MGKGHDVDVLAIPAGEIVKGDSFWLKGQQFTVWTVERLKHSALPDNYLLRINGETANYQTSIVVDSRLIFEAVFREVPDSTTQEEK